MDLLWSPWRYEYVKSGSERSGPAGQLDACVFCSLQADQRSDEAKFILLKGLHNFVVLNIYPYIGGHLMIVSRTHLADLDQASKPCTDEMMDLTKQCLTALRTVYSPQGFNIGMNLGHAAGAGVAGHIHQHVMPRWVGDVNFLTTVAETRVIPEDLDTTYKKLRPYF